LGVSRQSEIEMFYWALGDLRWVCALKLFLYCGYSRRDGATNNIPDIAGVTMSDLFKERM
jgi:hypothetical protein